MQDPDKFMSLPFAEALRFQSLFVDGGPELTPEEEARFNSIFVHGRGEGGLRLTDDEELRFQSIFGLYDPVKDAAIAS